MATDAMQVLEIFLMATDHRGIQPIRWNWDHVLLKELKLLDSDNVELKNLACLVCLILSAATTDQACIDSTVKLHDAGLLDVDKLESVEEKVLADIIASAGIQHRRAKFLKLLAFKLKELHNGKVPAKYTALMLLKGVGRKTAVLLRNELFGFWAGIGTDLHVFQLCIAFGFLLEEPDEQDGQDEGTKRKRSSLNVDDAEASLREWVLQSKHRDANKIFGSFAQLMTQDFEKVKSGEERQQLLRLVRAIGDYIHKPYHVELLWSMIFLCRTHYRNLPKQKNRKMGARVRPEAGSN